MTAVCGAAAVLIRVMLRVQAMAAGLLSLGQVLVLSLGQRAGLCLQSRQVGGR
jgi:hypothetical protein